MFQRGFNHQVHRQFGIIVVADRYRQAPAYAAIRITPVGHFSGDQVLIRYQCFDTVTVTHHHIAGIQFLHPAKAVANRNHITWLDRTIEDKNKSADEIAEYFLQAETDTDTDGATEHRKGGEINTNSFECEQDSQAIDDELAGFGQYHAHARVEVLRTPCA